MENRDIYGRQASNDMEGSSLAYSNSLFQTFPTEKRKALNMTQTK
jgi:hypothetical protein